MSTNPLSEDEKQKTIQYYDENAKAFYTSTVNLDVSELHAPFIQHLPPGAHVLDAGCGSGRDSLAFKKHGCTVTAFDASPQMADMASALISQPVQVMTFQEIEDVEVYDGIWACASLLHVPTDEMDDVLDRLTRALKLGGFFYVSFKYGEGATFQNGRLFSDYTESTFAQRIESHPQLEIIQLWTTEDVRPGRESERWLNGLLRKGTDKD